MTETSFQTRPAWQTDELEDEWIDDEDSVDSAHSGSDLSLTQPFGSVLVQNDNLGTRTTSDGSAAGGTFLVREDVLAAPLLPMSPMGRNKKLVVKDFFSPLPLERMFEPPSPPSNTSAPLPTTLTAAPKVPSRLSQVSVPESDHSTVLEHGSRDLLGCGGDSEESSRSTSAEGRTDMECQFTFAVPRPSPFNVMGPIPEAQSTPGPLRRSSIHFNNPPSTDPRLRLFQFQYDTFTRDHLSAMVDSIAVNTPSGGSGTTPPGSGDPSPAALSPIHETGISRLRSAKRVKLSPASEYSEDGDGTAIIMRPLGSRKDYVGESKSLMEKIRQARDFSTVSTVATSHSLVGQDNDIPRSPEDCPSSSTAQRPSYLRIPSDDVSGAPSSNGTATSSKRSAYSSLDYREQAANLMAQIRSDMKGTKRLFSWETEVSHQQQDEEKHESSGVSYSADDLTRSLLGDSSEKGNYGSHSRKSSAARLSSSARAKQKASPRKLLRRISAADEVDRELAEDISNMSLESQLLLDQFPPPPVVLTNASTSTAPPSPLTARAPEINPALLAPPGTISPAYPLSSLRGKEDLTRFVSSSTASGTTLTAGSASSSIRPQGPTQITRITPNDVPALPERVGKMVFDRVMMKWVKATVLATADMSEEDATALMAPLDGETDSEDPFRDIESLREEDSSRRSLSTHGDGGENETGSIALDKSRVEDVDADTEVEDEEEAELTSFSTDGPSVVEVGGAMEGEAHGGMEEDSESEDEGDQDGTDTTGPSESTAILSDNSDEDRGDDDEHAPQRRSPQYPDLPATTMPSTPMPPTRSSANPPPTPMIRSAMKSSSITPVSVMKDPNRGRQQTPANKTGHRRSVSFSDGKRDGPIRGIGRNAPTPDGSVVDDSALARGSSKGIVVLAPSARSKRIADMLDDLENASDEESPSKSSGSGRRPSEVVLQPLRPRRPTSTLGAGSSDREASRRVFSRLHLQGSSRDVSRNATFLTECSFGVAHDRLVQVITDVQPFEPYWEELTSIDLSNRHIDSAARLKEFLPRLDSLSLNFNQLSWLSGIPGTVRTLSVASNTITGLTSFSHLLNLENLDISRNQVDSLRQLECLRHLRELRADGNRIDSVDGLQKMDGLVKLSLQGNNIHDVDLRGYRWTRLEMLNLSHNRLSSIEGLGSLPSLIALNLDHNLLGALEPDASMPRLRILRVSANRLQSLNAAPCPNLRTLYADNNSLGTIVKAHRLTKLENLSLRNQSGRPGLSIQIRDVRDAKRLYLSGNALKPGFMSEACYNLVYLELAACRLTVLPPDLARAIPNVRVLNLNYNFLDDPRPLEGLTRLRKLTIIGSRIKAAKQIVRVLRGMKDVEMLDFRMNPCTLGWYLPLLVKDVPGALQPSDGERPFGAPGPQGRAEAPRADPGSAIGPPPSREEATPGAGTRGGEQATWRELDAKFRRDLPNEAYVGRLAYRGLVMRACPAVRMLDGVEVERKEREKAEMLLKEVLERRKAQG